MSYYWVWKKYYYILITGQVDSLISFSMMTLFTEWIFRGHLLAKNWTATYLSQKLYTVFSKQGGGTKLKSFSHVDLVKHTSGTYKYPSELLLFRNQQDSSVDISIDIFFHSETELKTSCFFLKQHRCLQ